MMFRLKHTLVKLSKRQLAVTLMLSLTLTACQTTTPKVEPLYIPKITLAEAQTLEIFANRISCDSSSPMQCLQVRAQGQSEIFGIGYNDIKGFEPKLGVKYVIKASQEIDENTGKATGSWQLHEILHQR